MKHDTTLLPARGDDAVEILLNDHRVIRGLLDELGETAKGKLNDILECLKGVLTIHNATEENLIYPALNKAAGSRLEAQHLYHETAEADTLMFEISTALAEGDEEELSARIQSFVDAVRHHMDEEERKALPRLRENVEAPDRKRLTDSVKKFRSAMHFDLATA
jgi:hemerythrin superfamily protein